MAGLKVTQMTKRCGRTYSDKNYGSINVSTEITVDIDNLTEEQQIRAERQLAKMVRDSMLEDLDAYLALKEKKEAL